MKFFSRYKCKEKDLELINVLKKITASYEEEVERAFARVDNIKSDSDKDEDKIKQGKMIINGAKMFLADAELLKINNYYGRTDDEVYDIANYTNAGRKINEIEWNIR